MTATEFLALVDWGAEEAPVILKLLQAAASALEGKLMNSEADANAAVQAAEVAADTAEEAKFGGGSE